MLHTFYFFVLLVFPSFSMVCVFPSVITLHTQRERGKVIDVGVHIYILYVCGPKKFELYFSDRLTFSNIHSRISR